MSAYARMRTFVHVFPLPATHTHTHTHTHTLSLSLSLNVHMCAFQMRYVCLTKVVICFADAALEGDQLRIKPRNVLQDVLLVEQTSGKGEKEEQN